MCLGKLPLGVGGVLNSGASPLKAGAMGLAGLLLGKRKSKGRKPTFGEPGHNDVDNHGFPKAGF